MYTQSEFKRTFKSFVRSYIISNDKFILETFRYWWRKYDEYVDSENKSTPFLIEIPWLAKRLIHRFNAFVDVKLSVRQFMVYLFDMFSTCVDVLDDLQYGYCAIRGPVLGLTEFSGSWHCFAYIQSDQIQASHEDHIVGAYARAPIEWPYVDYELSLPKSERLHFDLKEYHKLFGFEIPVFESCETLNYNHTRINARVSGPFSGNYLILNWDRDNIFCQWAVIGDFDLHHLVFLTRDKVPTERMINRMARSALAFGYDKLERLKYRMFDGIYERAKIDVMDRDYGAQVLQRVDFKPTPMKRHGVLRFDSFVYGGNSNEQIFESKNDGVFAHAGKTKGLNLQGDAYAEWVDSVMNMSRDRAPGENKRLRSARLRAR